MSQSFSQSKSNVENSLSTKHEKRTVRKRFSKFLLKMLRNFNQAVPNHSSVNARCETSAIKDASIANDRPVIVIERNKYDQTPYGIQYRRRSLLRRTSTLMSIKEENESELLNST